MHLLVKKAASKKNPFPLAPALLEALFSTSWIFVHIYVT